MVKPTLIVLVLLSSLVASGCTCQSAPSSESKALSDDTVSSTSPSPSVFQPLTAQFLIFTNGTPRTFNHDRYLNQSTEVYLTAADPSLLHVDAAQITWADFFATLPMKVEATCLTTGTGQHFCTNDQNSLKFYLNGKLRADALSQVIQAGDQLLVSYGPKDDPAIASQLQQF